jgi:hypothetical protein
MIVDTQGNILALKVIPANVPERQALRVVVTPELVKRFPRLEKLLGDQGFEGENVVNFVKEETGLVLEIVKHPGAGRRGEWEQARNSSAPKGGESPLSKGEVSAALQDETSSELNEVKPSTDTKNGEVSSALREKKSSKSKKAKPSTPTKNEEVSSALQEEKSSESKKVKTETPTKNGFRVLPKRWIVERTFGWFNRQRRFSKDYEFLMETSQTMLLMAMGRRHVRRLAHAFRSDSVA